MTIHFRYIAQPRGYGKPTLSCRIKKFGSPDLFTLGRGLRKFFAVSSTTMESILLKELNFGLQKRTGPSSGVVPSIVLVSPGLDCPGVCLAEVCAVVAWSLKCNIWR